MNAIDTWKTKAAEEFRFAFGAFSLGRVLVAVGDKGVAAILIGDGPDGCAARSPTPSRRRR